jgi:hypothetical protein
MTEFQKEFSDYYKFLNKLIYVNGEIGEVIDETGPTL